VTITRHRLTLAAPLKVIWRRGRKMKDRWPYITLHRVVWTANDDILAADNSAYIQAVDERQAEPVVADSAIASAGVLWDLQAAFDETVGNLNYAILEAALYPRTVACDRLEIVGAIQSGVTVAMAVEWSLSFTEDHEEWIRAKQRGCHDE